MFMAIMWMAPFIIGIYTLFCCGLLPFVESFHGMTINYSCISISQQQGRTNTRTPFSIHPLYLSQSGEGDNDSRGDLDVSAVVSRSNECLSDGRRMFFKHIACQSSLVSWTMMLPFNNKAWAEDETWTSTTSSNTKSSLSMGLRPFAPLEALLPAARVKLLIDQSYQTTKELELTLKKNNNNSQDNNDQTIVLLLLAKLEGYLLKDTYDFQKKRKKIESISSPSKMYRDSYREQMNEVPLAQKPLALLTQAGDYRQNQLLRNRQNQMEKDNAIRAALNTYTKALQFDSKNYLLTANPTDRKRIIRNQGTVPDIQSVITSDLDLRDLYRNQILTLWEDARAEFRYQLLQLSNNNTATNNNDSSTTSKQTQSSKEIITSSLSTVDLQELMDILGETKKACDAWFSFISEDDIREAMAVVTSEANDNV